jgi:hypothetical protein
MDVALYALVSDDAKLEMEQPSDLKRVLRGLIGEVVEVIIRKRRSKRSDRANRWYWGCILEALSEKTGHTPDELHEYCKARFIPKRLAICDGNGVVIDDRVVGGSTTKLNREEMADFCEEIRRWAAQDLELVIPDPDPKWAR